MRPRKRLSREVNEVLVGAAIILGVVAFIALTVTMFLIGFGMQWHNAIAVTCTILSLSTIPLLLWGRGADMGRGYPNG